MTSEWKPVPGFRGYYSVSRDGRVRSEQRYAGGVSGSERLLPSVELAATPDENGRRRVTFSVDGSISTHLVHRLVALTFIGPPPAGTVVTHIDGDFSNNHVDNLEYVTKSEVSQRAAKRGAASGPRKRQMGMSGAEEIREAYLAGRSLKSISRTTGYAVPTVSRIINNHTYPSELGRKTRLIAIGSPQAQGFRRFYRELSGAQL